MTSKTMSTKKLCWILRKYSILKIKNKPCEQGHNFDWLRGMELNHRPPGYGPGKLPLLYLAISCILLTIHIVGYISQFL